MTDLAFDPTGRFTRRLRTLLLAVPVVVVLAAVAASAVEARSLLVGGAALIGWSQLVGL